MATESRPLSRSVTPPRLTPSRSMPPQTPPATSPRSRPATWPPMPTSPKMPKSPFSSNASLHGLSRPPSFSVSRNGSFAQLSVFDSDEEVILRSMTVSSRLEELGVGPYQVLLLMGVGIAQLSECFDMGSIAPMNTALAHSFGFSHFHRTALPACTFSGQIIGLAVSGPFCDWWGRRGALLLSVFSIAAIMLVTAALPTATSPLFILALRFGTGVAGAIQVPAGLVLAVESAPQAARTKLSFGISFLAAIGYLLEAVGIKALMPQFGEASSDSWRAFSFLTAIVALSSVPFVLMLRESPCFLAVRGDADRCAQVLDDIAWMNGKPPLQASVSVDVTQPESPVKSWKQFTEVAIKAFRAVNVHMGPVFLLCLIDAGRSFFTSGSAYLWKDLFKSVDTQEYVSASSLNIITSISPLLGLLIAVRFIPLGVQRITFLSGFAAAVSTSALTIRPVREAPLTLLCLVTIAKLTYGPLGSCVALLKAEAFPTEVRTSVFALVGMVAKLVSVLSPTLVEALKGKEKASSWNPHHLELYLASLVSSAALCAMLAPLVPYRGWQKGPADAGLEDYVDDQSTKPFPALGKMQGLGGAFVDDQNTKSPFGSLNKMQGLGGAYGTLAQQRL